MPPPALSLKLPSAPAPFACVPVQRRWSPHEVSINPALCSMEPVIACGLVTCIAHRVTGFRAFPIGIAIPCAGLAPAPALLAVPTLSVRSSLPLTSPRALKHLCFACRVQPRRRTVRCSLHHDPLQLRQPRPRLVHLTPPPPPRCARGLLPAPALLVASPHVRSRAQATTSPARLPGAAGSPPYRARPPQ